MRFPKHHPFGEPAPLRNVPFIADRIVPISADIYKLPPAVRDVPFSRNLFPIVISQNSPCTWNNGNPGLFQHQKNERLSGGRAVLPHAVRKRQENPF